MEGFLMKRRFLVVLDYGMGGIWASVLAESKQQILDLYPEVDVFEDKPEWMSEAKREEIERRDTCDIDDEDAEFFETVRRYREHD